MSLHRPFTRGQWPPHFGGVGFPPSRGKYSAAWQKKLAESGAPMWPDPDDPACHGEPEVPKPLAGRRDLLQNRVGSLLNSPSRGGRRVSSSSICPGRGKEERIGFLPDWITGYWSTMMSSSTLQWDLEIWPPTQVRGWDPSERPEGTPSECNVYFVT